MELIFPAPDCQSVRGREGEMIVSTWTRLVVEEVEEEEEEEEEEVMVEVEETYFPLYWPAD